MSKPKTRSPSILGRLLEHQSARWALAVIAILIVAAVLGPLVARDSCNAQPDIVGMKNLAPSWRHPFGTDQYSRDLMARVMCGARISLAVAILAVSMSVTIGMMYGMIAGYAGGRVDSTMMRVLDGFLSIPRVLLVISVLSLWHPVPLAGLILLLGATGWFGVSRFVRAETLAARQMDYVASARALGVPDLRIVWRHILPNVFAPVIVAATLAVGNVIALEAGLSYLGVGAREPNASWGSIFLDGADFFVGNWWVVFFPGVAIVATVLAFNVLGDALRDVLDPRQLPGTRSSLASNVPAGTGTESMENG